MEKSIHICFMNTISFWGGGEKWYYDSINYFLTRKDIKISAICSHNSKLSTKLKAINVDVYETSFSNFSFMYPWKKKFIQRVLNKMDPDIIIMNSSLDLKHAAIASRKAGVPVRIYLRGYGGSIRKNRKNAYYFSRELTHIITNSEFTARRFNVFDEVEIHDKVHTLYNGIDVDNYYHVENDSDYIRIGTSSRLIKLKRLDHALGALKILDKENIALHIAGIGEELTTLQHLNKKLEIKSKVIFHGFIENIPKFLSKMDFFIHPARGEAFGFSVVEAMAAELPVIAYRSGAMPEIIVDGKTGFLCEDENIPCLAEKIEKLALDKELRIRMGREARNRIEEKFNKKIQFHKLESMLRKWLSDATS